MDKCEECGHEPHKGPCQSREDVEVRGQLERQDGHECGCWTGE